jgi:hypothetical protein
MSEVFGRIVHKAQVERAALATLSTWNSTYLTEMEIQDDRANPLERPRFMVVQSIAKFAEDAPPLIMVVSNGLAGRPQREGQGIYRATWKLATVALASAKDEASSNELAGLYLAAVKALLVQKPSLDGFAESVVWVDEDYDRVPIGEKRRMIAAAYAEFEIEIRDVLTADAGPLEPDGDHPQDWGVVRSTELDLQREPV